MPARAEERIWMQASINGKPARLFLDTGASTIILFDKGARRLGVPFSPLPENPPRASLGGMLATQTEECDLVLGGSSLRTPLLIVHAPDTPEVTEDGLVGWQPVSRGILRIDADQAGATSLPSLPEEVATWSRFRLQTNSPCLDLEVPARGGRASIIRLDTGSGTGARLSPQQWREWSAQHPAHPRTLTEYYAASGRLIVSEEAWADKLSLGDLVLVGVPLIERDEAEAPPGVANHVATLGLMALRCMDLVVDGRRGVAYVRPKKTTPPTYAHNCLGAVFVPPDLLHPETGNLAARVLEGSPAYEAGIRNGDILLKLGDNETIKPGINQIRLHEQFMAPTNGTKLALTLRRGTETFVVTPMLRQILKPAVGGR